MATELMNLPLKAKGFDKGFEGSLKREGRSAGFPTCRIADFQSADRSKAPRFHAWSLSVRQQVINLRYGSLSPAMPLKLRIAGPGLG